MEKMTKEEAIEALRKCQARHDIEEAHIEADSVLTELLTDLGYGEVVDEWHKVDKWYA